MGEFPSKEHQFKPGNPGGGRPKGTGITDRLRQLVMDDTKDAAELRERLAQAALVAAQNADHKFWKEIVDRLEGPVTNKHELSGNAAKPIAFEFVDPPKRSGDAD